MPTFRASFNRDDDVAHLDGTETVLPRWLEDAPGLPGTVKEAQESERAARAEAMALARAVRQAESDLRRFQEESERRLAIDGTPIDVKAEATFQAAVSRAVTAHRAAGRAHRAALQGYADAVDAESGSLHRLTVEVVLSAHAEAEDAGKRFVAAVANREAAYAALGYPGEDAWGDLPDRAGLKGAVYWGRRTPAATLVSDRLLPQLPNLLSTVSAIAGGFPVVVVEALSEGRQQ